MHRAQKLNNLISITIVVALLLVGFAALKGQTNVRAEPKQQLDNPSIYLPLVSGNAPIIPTFGAEVPRWVNSDSIELGDRVEYIGCVSRYLTGH